MFRENCVTQAHIERRLQKACIIIFDFNLWSFVFIALSFSCVFSSLVLRIMLWDLINIIYQARDLNDVAELIRRFI